MAEKLIITDDVREQLYGLLPMKQDAEHSFVPHVYASIQDENLHPTFTVVQLSQEDVDTVEALAVREVMESRKKKKPSADYLVKRSREVKKIYEGITNNCIVGWDNLLNLTTLEEIPYDSDLDIGDVLKGADAVISSIFTEVLKISGMGNR